MRSICVILLSLMSACWTIVCGQQLDVLIDSMLASNPELRYYEANYMAALERVGQVNTLPDPEFGVGGFALPVETRLGAQRLRLSGTQMFPWFGTLDAKESLALTSASIEYQPELIKALDLRFKLIQSYLDIYELVRTGDIIQREIDVLSVLRPFLVSKIESGEGSMADVLRLDTRMEEMKQELVILEAKEETPQAEINQLIGRDSQVPVNVVDTLVFAEIPYLIDTLKQHIDSLHPEIRLYSLKQEQSHRKIELNDKMRMPSLGVGADYIFVSPRDDMFPERNGRDILQLKAMVSVPLYGRKYDAVQREEEFRIEALEHKKKDASNKFISEISSAIAMHRTARLQLDLYMGQLENVRSARRILESDYSASGNKFDELLEVEMELLNYDIKILRAVVDSHRSVASIQRLVDYIK